MIETIIMTEKGRKDDEAQYREAVRAMEKGDQSAKTKVAFYKLSGCGGVEVDTDEAVVLLEERAKDRDGEAMWILGLCCEYGIGTERDIGRSKLLYRQSSECGSVVGSILLKNEMSGTRRMSVARLKKEMVKPFCETIFVAPWTSLDLGCERRVFRWIMT